jgi:hypothetical protein
MKATIWKRASVLGHAFRFARRAGMRGLGVLGLTAGAIVAASGACSSSKTAEQLYVKCALNSDCDPGLVCTIGLVCRPVCKTSADCGSGGSCVTDDEGHAVCRSPIENSVACDVSNTCPIPLVCASDYHCRDTCMTDSDCNIDGATGRTCALDLNNRNYCADPPELNSSGVIADTPPHLLDGAAPDSPAPPPDASVSPEGSTNNDDAGTDSAVAPDTGSGPPDAGGGPAPDAAGSVDANAGSDGRPDAPSSTSSLSFTPSNFDPTTVNFADAGALTDPQFTQGAGATVMMSDGTFANLYVVKSLIVDQSQTLTLSGTLPVVIAAQTTVNIQGKIVVMPGTAGGFVEPNPPAAGNPGPGAGGNGAVPPNTGSAAAGGSFCGIGGLGGASTGTSAAGGPHYSSSTLSPLIAGSAGGNGACGLGGGGGGAIQITAGVSITIGPFGAINAGGQGGTAGCENIGGPGGGGAGGAILLEAPSVTILGAVAANGGGGGAQNTQGQSGVSGMASNVPAAGGSPSAGVGSAGPTIAGGDGIDADAGALFDVGGGGGAGRIRINTSTGGFIFDGGIISPDLSTMCATTGPIQ